MSFKTKLWLFFVIAIVVLTAMAGLVFRTVKQNKSDYTWVVHTNDVLLDITKARSAIKDNILAATRYVLVADTAAGGLMRSHRATIFGHLYNINAMVRDNPAQQELLKQVGNVIEERLALSDSIMAVTDRSGPVAGTIMVQYAMRKDYLQRINKLVAEFENEERRLLQMRKARFIKSQDELTYSVIALAIASVIGVSVTFRLVTDQFAKRQKAEKEILEINAGLEERVSRNTEVIRQHESRYRRMLDSMMEGAQIIGNDWRYIYLNDAAVRQAKVPRSQLIGRTMMEVYPGVEESEMFRVLDRCIDTRKPEVYESEFVYADGTMGYFELRVEPAEEGIFILSMDITDRVLKEKERKRRMGETTHILHRISHEIRQPVTSIIGVSRLLNDSMVDRAELDFVASEIRESLDRLDRSTRNLSEYISSIPA
ncbi:MAG: CHASE3 domain-containing protein [Flavipsychrobacter sp.]|nr:CHASE3 domain-containing protein [Flavipsychrobacter sp.]